MNKKYNFVLLLLIIIFIVSSFFIIKEIVENKKETDIYKDLQEIVTEQESSKSNKDQKISNEEISESKTVSKNNYNLKNISNINSDVIGWIKINGTNIDYPVMQNKDYYLHRNIYKNYSSHGTPYLSEYCNIKYSDNLIIYGHNMNDNSMFAELENYKKYNFYKEHKYIKFYSLYNGQTTENSYEIVIVFKTVAYSEKGFKYYNYTNFSDKQDLDYFLDNCRNLEFYDTGIKVNYGDKLITLSTCEYSEKNGRIVVIAKQL